MEPVLSVFVTDDSAPVRERLAALISDMQAVELVGQAGDPYEALEVIQRLRPQVVILDIRMTGCNGFRVLEIIKRDMADTVVIMLTAFPFPQYRRKCLDAGAAYFFDKATEFHLIGEALEQLQQRISSQQAVSYSQ